MKIDMKMVSSKEESFDPIPLFVTKESYRRVADEFHRFHRHDLNVFVHLWTTGLGIWGAVQLASLTSNDYAIIIYGCSVLLTTPLRTGILHALLLFSLEAIPSLQTESHVSCVVAIVAGYGLQDLSHYLCDEPAFMASYIRTRPFALVSHSLWLLPLLIDAVLDRGCFLDHAVNRNRTVVAVVDSKAQAEGLRSWILKNVPESKETTHVWPHEQKETSRLAKALEGDAAVLASFRKVFPAKHYDIRGVVSMNEIYVTAVGAKREMNSDAVFYTPHTDGPFWFLPGASLYRVLVGLTPNTLVRTRLNLQHESQDKVIDRHQVLGFDYNRELHWIDHTDEPNGERRSLLKLHYIVYPKGWHRYGNLCSSLNSSYNTWARGNFVRTLRPDGTFDKILAWWIWVTTWTNAYFNIYIGWNNLVYVLTARTLGSGPFLVLTSFRHYVSYLTTFGFRESPVALGEFIRDAKLYKTLALCHLGRILLPHVSLSEDVPTIVAALVGFLITVSASARLGDARTYFGSELGFVKPERIEGFPYGTIPHPMITGQVFAFGMMLVRWGGVLDVWERVCIGAHIGFYLIHMTQEIFYSGH